MPLGTLSHPSRTLVRMVIARVFERLESADVGAMSAVDVVSGLRDIARVEAWAAATKTRFVQRAEELAAVGDGPPAEEVLGADRRLSRREAARIARRSEALSSLPAMSALLGKGRIGAEHVDVVAAAARRVGAGTREALFGLDEQLAQYAASRRPEQFRRYVTRLMDRLRPDARQRRSTRQRNSCRLARGIDPETGMYWLHGEFDPESGARVFSALDAEIAARRAAEGTDISADAGRPSPEMVGETPLVERLGAEALADLATSAHRSRRPGRTEVSVLVDLSILLSGLHDHGVCELGDGSEISAATARRLACDADIIPVVLGGDSQSLDVGRAQRQATPAQRRALRAMYRTCGIEGCDLPFDQCEIHHVLEWIEHRGPTDLANLIPACSRHHHLVHEGRWRLELDPLTRELTVWLPDGTLFQRCLPDSVAERTAGMAA